MATIMRISSREARAVIPRAIPRNEENVRKFLIKLVKTFPLRMEFWCNKIPKRNNKPNENTCVMTAFSRVKREIRTSIRPEPKRNRLPAIEKRLTLRKRSSDVSAN